MHRFLGNPRADVYGVGVHPSIRSFGALIAVLFALLLPSAAQAEGGIRKGPWLMAPRPGAITVMVERDAPGAVLVRAWRVAPEGVSVGAPIEVRDEARVQLHEVLLEGLAAGVRYHYQVSGEGLTTTEGIFSTAPQHADSFRFLMYGDTRSSPSTHAAVVNAMRREGADFVVHTGDLVADGRVERQWNDFFAVERDLLRDTVFIPVIGNHELRNSSRQGIENFRHYVNCPPPDAPRPELDYVVRFGNVRMILANAYDDWSAEPMRTWLEDHLAQERREGPDDFLLVITHWGMHSSGPHGENRGLRAAGLPDLFRRYHVDLVVAGHDHAYERGEERGLHYMVTGGSGAPLYAQRIPRPYTRFFSSQHHYVRVDADGEKLEFTALRPDGTLVDRFTLRRPRSRNRAAAVTSTVVEHPVVLASASAVSSFEALSSSRRLHARRHREGAVKPRRFRTRDRSRWHRRTRPLPVHPALPGPELVSADELLEPPPAPEDVIALPVPVVPATAIRFPHPQLRPSPWHGVETHGDLGVGLLALGLCAAGLRGSRRRDPR